jgi:hypothetical protein
MDCRRELQLKTALRAATSRKSRIEDTTAITDGCFRARIVSCSPIVSSTPDDRVFRGLRLYV